MTDTKSQK